MKSCTKLNKIYNTAAHSNRLTSPTVPKTERMTNDYIGFEGSGSADF